jgi:hypothetical protein
MEIAPDKDLWGLLWLVEMEVVLDMQVDQPQQTPQIFIRRDLHLNQPQAPTKFLYKFFTQPPNSNDTKIKYSFRIQHIYPSGR